MEISKKDVEVMSRTIYGEARGEGSDGMLAVGHVIHNRAQRGGWWGSTIEQVCKHPYQFSCWNENDPNREKLLAIDANDEAARECLWAALSVVQGKHQDNTSGSCHYHAASIMPDWAENKISIGQIGNHLFYNDVD